MALISRDKDAVRRNKFTLAEGLIVRLRKEVSVFNKSGEWRYEEGAVYKNTEALREAWRLMRTTQETHDAILVAFLRSVDCEIPRVSVACSRHGYRLKAAIMWDRTQSPQYPLSPATKQMMKANADLYRTTSLDDESVEANRQILYSVVDGIKRNKNELALVQLHSPEAMRIRTLTENRAAIKSSTKVSRHIGVNVDSTYTQFNSDLFMMRPLEEKQHYSNYIANLVGGYNDQMTVLVEGMIRVDKSLYDGDPNEEDLPSPAANVAMCLLIELDWCAHILRIIIRNISNGILREIRKKDDRFVAVSGFLPEQRRPLFYQYADGVGVFSGAMPYYTKHVDKLALGNVGTLLAGNYVDVGVPRFSLKARASTGLPNVEPHAGWEDCRAWLRRNVDPALRKINRTFVETRCDKNITLDKAS